MKILINLADEERAAIDRIAAAQQRPRKAVIQDAIAEYLTQYRRRVGGDAFGLRGNHEADGLEYQRKLREEWD